MKSKPAKYGIKIWAVVDMKTSYVYNLQVYIGKVGNKRQTDQGNRIVKELIESIFGTGRSDN